MSQPVTLEDGSVHYFPDEATPDQIQTALQGIQPSVTSQDAAPATDPSLAENLARQSGLTGRYILEGLTAVPGMVANVTTRPIMNAAAKAMGSDYQFPDQTTALPNALNLPQPNTPTERVVGDVSRAVAALPAFGAEAEGLAALTDGGAAAQSAAPGASMADKLATALKNIPGSARNATNSVANMFADGATSIPSAVGAAGGAAASGGAREGGASPAGQALWGLAGGIAAPTALTGAGLAAQGAYQVGKTLIQPALKSGQNQMIANALADMTSNVPKAVENLEASQPTIQGSNPTAGPASQDYGLIMAEKGLRTQFPDYFANINYSQNRARVNAFDQMAGTKQDVQNAVQSRDEVTAPMRQQAFENAAPINADDLVNNITGLMGKPGNAGSTVQAALGDVKNAIQSAAKPVTYLGENGEPFVQNEIHPEDLYGIRKDNIGNGIAGKLAGDKSSYRLAAGQLMDARGIVDNALETSAPGFKNYLSTYSNLSQPINQMELLQDMRSGATAPNPDVASQDVLAAGKMRNQMNKNAPEVTATLNPAMQQKLGQIQDDLNMSGRLYPAETKTPNSDTAQNISIANSLARATGVNSSNPLVHGLGNALDWLYTPAEQAMNRKMASIVTNPQQTAQYIKNAKPATQTNIGQLLADRLRQYSTGTTTGLATQGEQ